MECVENDEVVLTVWAMHFQTVILQGIVAYFSSLFIDKLWEPLRLVSEPRYFFSLFFHDWPNLLLSHRL